MQQPRPKAIPTPSKENSNKIKSATPVDLDVDDEFTAVVTEPGLDEQSNSNAIQKALQNRKNVQANDDTVDFSEEIKNLAVNQQPVPAMTAGEDVIITPQQDESTQFLSAGAGRNTTESILAQAKKALGDIVEVYGSGMGDQEVVLMAAGLDEGKGNKPVEKGEGLFGGTTLNQLGSIQEHEDEDEDIDEQPTKNENQEMRKETISGISQTPLVRKTPEGALDEFDQIALDTHHEEQSTQTEQAPSLGSNDALLSYSDALSYFTALDMSAYAPNIVTKEPNESKAGGWMKIFSGGVKPLAFNNCEEQLKIPFLIAEVSYDPYQSEHLGMLRYIYSKLVSEQEAKTVSALDDRWEKLGFQGRDPRTDLNRSIRSLSILQVN